MDSLLAHASSSGVPGCLCSQNLIAASRMFAGLWHTRLFLLPSGPQNLHVAQTLLFGIVMPRHFHLARMAPQFPHQCVLVSTRIMG